MQTHSNFAPMPTLKAWVIASRPRALSLSFVPILIGMSLAYLHLNRMDWFLAISTLLCIPWIQIGMHFVNDALDFQKGEKIADQLRLERVKFLSPQQLLKGGYVCFALTLLFGLPLMLKGGWVFVFLLFLSISLGYLYTGGPFPLSYTGISEIFILIFYGWVSTTGTYYLQTGKVNLACLLAGSQMGCLAIVPHAINNLRDHRQDALVQKKTLAVRFGPHFARWEITVFSLFPFFLGLFWINITNGWSAILPFLCLPFVLFNLKSIWQNEPGKIYTQFLAKSALAQSIFGFLLMIGLFAK